MNALLNVTVVVEESIDPPEHMQAVVDSIEEELSTSFTESSCNVHTTEPLRFARKRADRSLEGLVRRIIRVAKPRAPDDETIAAYVMPTEFKYELDGRPDSSDIVIIVCLVHERPTGVFIEFCEPEKTPQAVADALAQDARGLKETVLKGLLIPPILGDISRQLVQTIKEGLAESPKYLA